MLFAIVEPGERPEGRGRAALAAGGLRVRPPGTLAELGTGQCQEPPDVTWPLPELAVGADELLSPLLELELPELELPELPELELPAVDDFVLVDCCAAEA